MVPPIASGMGRLIQTEIFKDCSHKASSYEVQRGSFCPCIIVDKENGIDSVAREVLGRRNVGQKENLRAASEQPPPTSPNSTKRVESSHQPCRIYSMRHYSIYITRPDRPSQTHLGQEMERPV